MLFVYMLLICQAKVDGILKKVGIYFMGSLNGYHDIDALGIQCDFLHDLEITH